uniref:Uncharacterized protein n=1 Tax=Knipowitschia caucasica TaxID=637954 RepID=A0AAV2JLH9_KNICA
MFQKDLRGDRRKQRAPELSLSQSQETEYFGIRCEDVYEASPSLTLQRAMSISQTWYAIKDHGTNYCNLYNLMEGSGLTEARGYREVTSDFLCTQRSSANCTIY